MAQKKQQPIFEKRSSSIRDGFDIQGHRPWNNGQKLKKIQGILGTFYNEQSLL